MSDYSRMLLHFLHAAANAKGAGWAQVHAFTFGTRLTNITRHLRQRDVDAALAAAGQEALDWEGGTRIGACLHAFNRDWSRRVLGQGAVVLLITDGLDRDDPVRLGVEMERLHLSARRLIWLNPLLRWDGFAPRARGVRAMLPHVDTFRPATASRSLEELVAALGRRRSDPRDRLRAGADAAGRLRRGRARPGHCGRGSSSASTSSTKPPILPPVDEEAAGGVEARAVERAAAAPGRRASGVRAAGSAAGAGAGAVPAATAM